MKKRSPAGSVLSDLILEVFRLNGRLLAAGDQLTRPVGQTSARWQVLGAIDREPLSVSQVARAMGLTRQSVQRTADRLHAEGIVTYTDNPAHRRAKLVALTAEGRAVLDWITRRQVAWVNGLAAGLSGGELRRSLGVVRAFREALETAGAQGTQRTRAGSPAKGSVSIRSKRGAAR